MFSLRGFCIQMMFGGIFIEIFSYYLQAPNYPDAGRCWDIVDKYKVSIFYTAPTLVRSLMREGDEVSWCSNMHAIYHFKHS